MIPVSSFPATCSHGNPSGRVASRPHQCRRNPVTAVFTRASCSSPASDSARHTVGVEGTGPITGARCRSALEVADRLTAQDQHQRQIDQDLAPVIDRVEPPPRASPADNPARSPVRSASSRSGSVPACPTSRSSSPTSSSPSAHEVPCTEEVHPPQLDRDPREIAFWPVRCTSPCLNRRYGRHVVNPGERLSPTGGDGFFATFDGPARAIRCAIAIRDGLRGPGITVRAGMHTGEVELMGGKGGRIAVHIGARVSAQAGPDEVLVSRTVADLVAGPAGLAWVPAPVSFVVSFSYVRRRSAHTMTEQTTEITELFDLPRTLSRRLGKRAG